MSLLDTCTLNRWCFKLHALTVQVWQKERWGKNKRKEQSQQVLTDLFSTFCCTPCPHAPTDIKKAAGSRRRRPTALRHVAIKINWIIFFNFIDGKWLISKSFISPNWFDPVVGQPNSISVILEYVTKLHLVLIMSLKKWKSNFFCWIQSSYN